MSIPPNLPAVATAHCLVIAGADARRFAQAQFASDVDALVAGQWQWSAWLDPAGRVRALMQLFDPGDGHLVAMLRGGDAETIRAGLVPFLLRARARLTLRTCTVRAGPPESPASVRRHAECLILGLGTRSAWLDPAPAIIDAAARAEWRLADIRAGWPHLPVGEASCLAPALGLVRLGAVALGKGCYPGQEVIARLHYRGGRTRGLYHVRGNPWLAPGEHRTQGGTRRVLVLDVEASADACEALVIAPEANARNLDIDGATYAIASVFTN